MTLDEETKQMEAALDMDMVDMSPSSSPTNVPTQQHTLTQHTQFKEDEDEAARAQVAEESKRDADAAREEEADGEEDEEDEDEDEDSDKSSTSSKKSESGESTNAYGETKAEVAERKAAIEKER